MIASMPSHLDNKPTAEQARELLSRWAAIRELLDGLDRPGPDRLLVDHDKDEMTLVWEAEKYAVVIGPDDEEIVL